MKNKQIRSSTLAIQGITACVLGLGGFFFAQPYLAQAVAPTQPLIDIPDTVTLTQNTAGEQTITLSDGSDTTVLGVQNIPNVDPDFGNRYVVWSVQTEIGWQIMAYDLRSEQTIPLTSSGNNVNPVTDGENIAWEAQRDGVWHIMVFNGSEFRQITSGSKPIREISLERNLLVFTQQSENTEGWVGYIHNLDTKNTEPLHSPPQLIGSLTLQRGILSWNDQNGIHFQKNTENVRYYPVVTPVPQPPVLDEENTAEPEEADVDTAETPLLTPEFASESAELSFPATASAELAPTPRATDSAVPAGENDAPDP